METSQKRAGASTGDDPCSQQLQNSRLSKNSENLYFRQFCQNDFYCRTLQMQMVAAEKKPKLSNQILFYSRCMFDCNRW